MAQTTESTTSDQEAIVPVRPVPFDPQIAPVVQQMARMSGPQPTPETLPQIRRDMDAMNLPTEEVIGDRPIDAAEYTIPGPQGAPALEITVLSPRAVEGAVPGLYNIHGGGMMMGSRHMDTPRLADLVNEFEVVAVNVEYRLAPEHPHPAAAEDCYAGLVWTAAHASELRIDPARIVVMGGSAGGGLAAAMALMARDRGGPRLAGQMLLCPMIDDSNTTVASHQYAGLGTWTREANLAGWSSLLGDAAGTDAASPYAAPSRAKDLSGLPNALIEVGSAELFRDEDVEYARRIWATGGQAELHVWGGGCHGFDMYAPDSELTQAALATRTSWLRRVMGL